MGVGFMRISSSTPTIVEKIVQVFTEKPDPRNPDPTNFNLLKTKEVGDLFVSMVQYPNCTNYEGKKILVTEFDPRGLDKLDPHFSKRSGLIARFKPTEEGWLMAIGFAKSVAR